MPTNMNIKVVKDEVVITADISKEIGMSGTPEEPGKNMMLAKVGKHVELTDKIRVGANVYKTPGTQFDYKNLNTSAKASVNGQVTVKGNVLTYVSKLNERNGLTGKGHNRISTTGGKLQVIPGLFVDVNIYELNK